MFPDHLTNRKQKPVVKEFKLLQELTNSIILVNNPAEIANLILDIVTRYIDVVNCSLLLVNENDEQSILTTRGGVNNFVRYRAGIIGKGISGWAKTNRIPFFVGNIDKNRRFKKLKRLRYHNNTFISCPIIRNNRLFGVLNVCGKKDKSYFNADEFALIKMICNQASIAFENHVLVNRLKMKAVEMEEVNHKLMQMDMVKTEFLTRLSHELRNPLNSIKGSIYYLNQSDKMDVADQKDFFKIILKETDRLISFIENLLSFFETGDESGPSKDGVVDLAEILNEISESGFLLNLSGKKPFKLMVDIKGRIQSVLGDRQNIVKMFYHLIEGLTGFLKVNDILRIILNDTDPVRIDLVIPVNLPETLIRDFFHSGHGYPDDDNRNSLRFYLAGKLVSAHQWNIIARNTGNQFTVSIEIPENNKQKIDVAVNSSINFFLEFAAELLGLDTCSIMLINETTGELTIRSACGLSDDILKRTSIRPGDGVCGWVALEGKPLLIENIENDPRFARVSNPQYNTKSLLSIPLKMHGKVIGVLNLNNKKSGEPFGKRDFQLATIMAERFSKLIGRLYAGDFLENDLKQFISSLDELLNAGKKYRKKQAQFPDMVMQIMNRLDVTSEEKELALYVSTIYDLGLTILNDDFLLKKSLQPAEKGALRIHPFTTVGLINNFEFSEEVNRAILHHHERFDGTGYPYGLQGTQIPVISRVVAVIDTFFAMITKTPYSDKLTIADALRSIKNGSGTLYDPVVVQALEETIQNTMSSSG